MVSIPVDRDIGRSHMRIRPLLVTTLHSYHYLGPRINL